MNLQLILSLLGGLALFLYGMQMMSKDLELLAGNRMKNILERLTSTPALGVLVGAGITAVIQSSSATTVMTVGFVNAGLMTLQQAVWIIMGANIGTTITGQMIALDIGALAPLFAFVGVAMIMFAKREQLRYIGGIIAGLGVLFIGMGMMSDAMMPLRESERFIALMTRFSNPLLGILAGMIFTAIIQSSSASVGILQALAVSGLIGLDSAVFVLFGQNIGTCITAVLASIGTNLNARRTTVIHLTFNVIGTAIFTAVCVLTPFTAFMAGLTPENPAAQIANVHTIFNVTTTLILLPFGRKMARFAELVLPDKAETKSAADAERDEDAWLDEMAATQHVLGVSVMAIQSLKEEAKAMLALACDNVKDSFAVIGQGAADGISHIEAREDEIDRMNVRLSRRVAKVLTVERGFDDVSAKIKSEIENVGFKPLFYTLRSPRVLTSNKPVHTPADMQNVKIRLSNSAQAIACWEAVGASPQVMGLSECFTALNQGVVDAQENPYDLIYSSGFYDVQKYANETNHVYCCIYFTVGKKQFESLTPELQEAVLEASKEAQDFGIDVYYDQKEASKQACIDKGMEINTDVDRDAFREAMSPALKEYFGDLYSVYEEIVALGEEE